jgi:glutamyl-tRNA reductase
VLLCLTANHQNASFALLESLSTGAQSASAALVEQGDLVNGAVVLATCNRFEAYLDIDEPLIAARTLAVEATFDALSAASGVSTEALRAQITVLTDEDVPGHLFSVTSGLESVVIGEDEISGQVSRALDTARKSGTTSSALERLFQRASHTSRGVKNRTSIGGAGRSLVRLALELTSSRVTDWAHARVLVVGTGQYAGTTVAALHDRGATDISVFSPSGRAAKFALKNGLTLQEDLSEAIAAADVVITCTASLAVLPEHVTNDDRRIVIDLGLPRNVDPLVAALPGIEMLDLETIKLHAPLEELSAADEARSLVGAAAAEFAAETVIEPAIVALRSHIFDVLDGEIERAQKRGDDGTTEAALRHLAGVLLHGPSVRARELALDGRGDEVVAALDALYGIQARLGRAPGAAAASNPGHRLHQ